MKYLSIFLYGCFSAMVIIISCKKQPVPPPNTGPLPMKKIQFVLFTNEDFSNNNSNIRFTLSIRKPGFPALWDSLLPTIKVKDIPRLPDKLIIEKPLPAGNTSLLEAGFIYAIENVGISWYWDTIHQAETFKKVVFDFR